MNADLEQLQATLSELQAELAAVRERIAKIERVVIVRENDDGGADLTLQCTAVQVLSKADSQAAVIEIGCDEMGPFQAFYYPAAAGQSATAAIRVGIPGGEPHVQLRDRQGGVRCDTFVDGGRGVSVVFGPAGSAGAIMRGLNGGGSVAVLQPDGRPRGVLLHTESAASAPQRHGVPTELVFVNNEGQALLKLRADDQGATISLGPPGQPDAAALVARENGPALLLHSPEARNSVAIIAGEMAEVCVHQGHFAGGAAQACLTVGDFGSSLVLCRPDGAKSAEFSAFETASTLSLNDQAGAPCVVLSHHFGSHSSLSLQSKADSEAIRALASNEVSSLEVKAADGSDAKIVSAVHGEKPMSFIQKNNRALVMLGEGEQGGIVCAYGADGEHSGIATLSGGPVAGALVMATADGTAQVTVDATDHGGRLMINNDLGFQRIAMGVYQEAAGIHLNHTGRLGVQAVATPKGGVVTVRDSDGRILACLPDAAPPGGAADWGRSQSEP